MVQDQWARPLERRRGVFGSMNRIERLFGLRGEARVKYMDGEFQVLSAGDFVRCAVTGQPILLTELKYWNVPRQEPYATAAIAMQRHLDCRRIR